MKRVLTLMILVFTLAAISGCWSDDDDDDSNAGAESAAVWAEVSTGDSHAVALKSDGTVWTWGADAQGQLGLGTWVDKNLPMQVNSDIWTAVSAGDMHTFAMNSNERPYSWGFGIYCQLADPVSRIMRVNVPVMVTEDRNWLSVSAGKSHTLVLKETGRIFICGIRKLYEDGTPDLTVSLLQVGDDSDWISMDAGGYHNLALKSDGSLWAWGENSSGQLGIGSTEDQDLPCQVGSSLDWTGEFSAGDSHAVAIKTDGSLWAWGLNDNGRLGDGTSVSRTEPTLIDGANTWVKVSAGACHTLAVRSDGTLWAWGCNGDGRLGNGSNTDSPLPVQVGTDTDWAKVSAGLDFSVAIKSGGSMWAWGSNAYGQLGNGTNVSSNVPVPVGGE